MTTVIYARYSTNQQRATSIDDQVRRCRELAASHGLDVDDSNIYSDCELSGTDKDTEKRAGYQRLLADWDRRQFDTLIVDEWARLSRDGSEQALLVRRVEESGVRVLTADGSDTSRPNWQLTVGVKGLVSQQEIRDIRFRVKRGMVGQLERGFMIAAPPFGYRLSPQFSEHGLQTGTLWKIHPEEAALVVEVFERRRLGQSLAKIARWLNESGVRTPRKARRETGGYWRPGTVFQMLGNTIYRGVFVWNGSPFAKAKAKKKHATLDVREYDRPELRLVSDELWHAVNHGRVSRTGYGGGKHVFAGLFSCGICDSTLTVKQPRDEEAALYCAQCLQGRHVGGRESQTGYVSLAGVRRLLEQVLLDLLSDEVRDAFRKRLAQRRSQSPEEAIADVEVRLAGMRKLKERLLRVLTQVGGDDPDTERELARTIATVKTLEQELLTLKTRGKACESLAQHLTVDPTDYLGKLLDGSMAPEHVRAVLHRLLPELVLLGKPSRYVADFRVTLLPGVATAGALNTTVIDDETALIFHYRVSTSAKRPVVSTVARLAPSPPENDNLSCGSGCVSTALLSASQLHFPSPEEQAS